MLRRASLWVLSDICAARWLWLRGSLRVGCGRLLRDPFMTLAGRFDLESFRGRPLPDGALRRTPVR